MPLGNPGCRNSGLTNPVDVALDGNGAAVPATVNTTPATGQHPWPAG
jgi:hypothetical protein